MVEGYERTIIRCRKCRREVERVNVGNALVGKQDQLRCQECGGRGADLLRVWSVGKPPAGNPRKG